LIKDLVHGEHVNAVLLENSTHSVVATDLTLVVRVLKITLFDIFPNLLDSLRP